MICPLCGSVESELFFADHKVARADFFHCSICDLIFKNPEIYLDAKAERTRYEEHNNCSGDAGYARFLQPAADAVAAVCSKGAAGIDYGCGTGPVLSELLRAQGFAMRVYDPFFAPDESALQIKYDFVTCTEVAEHFYRPDLEFEKLTALLKPGGVLVLMTGMHRGREAFRTWHYRIDPTHVCFYSPLTMSWVARRYGFEVSVASTVATFKRGMVFLEPHEFSSRLTEIYDALKARICEKISGAQVEHIGSSALRGAISKGDLDVLVRVNGQDFAASLAAIEGLGFKIKEGTLRISSLCMLTTDEFAEDVAVQLIIGGSEFEDFVRFRDRLNENSDLAVEYNELKKSCAGLSSDAYRVVSPEFSLSDTLVIQSKF